jgi:hypothetical protein
VSGSCPRAELAAEHLANLPTHLRVQEQDAREIVSTLAEFLSVPPQAGDIPTTRDTSARLRDNAPIPGGVSAALG